MKALAVAISAVILAGCGSGGDSAFGGSPFAGSWEGTYDEAQKQDAGKFSMEVDSVGQVTISGDHGGGYEDFTGKGSVDKFGDIDAVFDGRDSGTVKGQLAVGKDGHLTGQFKLVKPTPGKEDAWYPVYVDLTRPKSD